MVRKNKRKRRRKRQCLQIVLDVAKQQVQDSDSHVLGSANHLECLRKECQDAQLLKNAIEKLKGELTCALSLEMFRDPVATEAGSVYERKYIEAWFSQKRAKGQPMTDPCTGLVITQVLTTVPDLKKLVEMVKENCLELDIKFVKEMQKEAHAIKQRTLNIQVIVQMPRENGGYTTRSYCVRRTITISALKNRFLVDVGLVNSDLKIILVDIFSGCELKSDITLMANGLRDGAVLHTRRVRSLSDFYQTSPTVQRQELSTRVPFQMVLPRAISYCNGWHPHYGSDETRLRTWVCTTHWMQTFGDIYVILTDGRGESHSLAISG